MDNAERKHISLVRRCGSLNQKGKKLFSGRNVREIGRIIIITMLFLNIGLSGCVRLPFSHTRNFPSVIVHFDSKEQLREFQPIRITDEFTTSSGDRWYVSHYFLLFNEDFLYRGDVEGVTILMHEGTEDVMAVYWQYGWLVTKVYTKEEIQDKVNVYLECGTHTFLPEPGAAAKTSDNMPLGLEETTFLSIFETLGRKVPPHGPTDGAIVVDTIDWKDVTYSLNDGVREMESWLEKQGVSGAPRTLRLEPLKSFSDVTKYYYLLDHETEILDIRYILIGGNQDFIPGQLAYISESRDFSQGEEWFLFQYILRTRAAEPRERIEDLGSGEAASLVYFLTGLTLPNCSFWVNLDPWEPERIASDNMCKTMIGRVLLEADLQMKKDFCKYDNPCESDIGKKYWDMLEKKAEELVTECMKEFPQEIQNVDNVSFNVVTRHWIVPGKITVYEDNDEIYIVEATLDIYSEPAYEHSTFEIQDQPDSLSSKCRGCLTRAAKEYGRYAAELEENLILPLVVKEVNTSDQYTDLRQVYTALVLAQWYKSHCEESLFAKFLDTENIEALGSWEGRDCLEIQKNYVRSFEEGEYNCVMEQQEGSYLVTRVYRGGGINFTELQSYIIERGSPGPAIIEIADKVSSRSLAGDGILYSGNLLVVLDENEKDNHRIELLMVFSLIAHSKLQDELGGCNIIFEMTVIVAPWHGYESLRRNFAQDQIKRQELEAEVHAEE
jgi:hypothetical protein